MQTHSIDLFPETLLVTREGEHIYTTSRRVAFYFGKRHDHVLRLIKKLLADMTALAARQRNFASANGSNFRFASLQNPAGGLPNIGESLTLESDFAQRNFTLSSYTNEQNKVQPEYRLTHDGFLFLSMRFTGIEAVRWQIVFVEAFRQQEAELAALRERYAAALDQIRPNLRPTVEAFEAGLPRIVTAQQLGKSVASISYYRGQARRFGLLPARQEVAA